MLQQKRASLSFLSFKGNYGFMLVPNRSAGIFFGFGNSQINRDSAFERFDASPEETTEPDDQEAPLDDAARSEREYVRQRLREELKREPTERELDEWLRQHTEGY
jgi:hypothetical protein